MLLEAGVAVNMINDNYKSLVMLVILDLEAAVRLTLENGPELSTRDKYWSSTASEDPDETIDLETAAIPSYNGKRTKPSIR